jgi:hypothetical protein
MVWPIIGERLLVVRFCGTHEPILRRNLKRACMPICYEFACRSFQRMYSMSSQYNTILTACHANVQFREQ